MVTDLIYEYKLNAINVKKICFSLKSIGKPLKDGPRKITDMSRLKIGVVYKTISEKT